MKRAVLNMLARNMLSFCIALACLLPACYAIGGVTNWLSNPTDDSWANAANWDNGVPNYNDPAQDHVAAFATSSVTTTYIDADKRIRGITFSADANDFTVNYRNPTYGVIYLQDQGITVDGGNQTFTCEVRPDFNGAVTVANNGTGLLRFGTFMANFNRVSTTTFTGSGDIRVNRFVRRTSVAQLTVVKEGNGTLTIDQGYGTAAGPSSSGYITGPMTIRNGVVSITGEASLGGNPADFNAGQLTFDGGTLQATHSFTIDDANRGLTVTDRGGTIDVADEDHTLTVAGTNPIVGPTTSPGALTKTGLGTLQLHADNSGFHGAVHVQQGTLEISHSRGLGSTANDTTVSDGATLRLSGGITVDEELWISGHGADSPYGALQSIGSGNVVNGAIHISGSLTRIAPRSADTLTLTGGITGDGGLAFSGWENGVVEVTDNPIDIGSSDFIANDQTTSRISVSGNNWGRVRIGYYGVVQVGVDDALPTDKAVEIGIYRNGNGTLDLYGHNQTIAGLFSSYDGDRRVVNSGSGTPTLTINNAADYSFPGVLGNSGQDTFNLVKSGSGTMTLEGDNTYSGTTTIDGGTLAIDGSLSTGGGAVTVNNGGTLAGSGQILRDVVVATGGTLGPGNSPGTMEVGSVDFASEAFFHVEIDGTEPGTGYDQLVVDGLVDLDGATLQLDLLSSSVGVGSELVIIDNLGDDEVVGTFADLAEGDRISAMLGDLSRAFQISYAGGTGNDVVLTAVPEPAGLLLALLAGLGFLVGRRRRR